MISISSINLSAGGLLIENVSVLLVKVTYGPNKGLWMLPGGNVEEGETLEEAAIREFKEETGLTVITQDLISLRSAVQEMDGKKFTSLYAVFRIQRIKGKIEADHGEIDDVRFWKFEDVIGSESVIDLTRQIVRASTKNSGFLRPGEPIKTNGKYLKYRYYVPRNR